MADIFFKVLVDDIDEVMQTYTHIRVFRATSLLGTYTEISTSGTRPVLQAGISEYTYHDDAGSTSYWYRSTFYSSTGPVESMPSDARNFGPWGILTDSLQRRLMSEGNNLSLGHLTDAVFDASCETVSVPSDLSQLSDIELSWLIRRATRHALSTLMHDWIAKPGVQKGTVSISMGAPSAQLMQRVRQMDEEWALARQNDLKVFEGHIYQLQDSDKTYSEIVGEGYRVDPVSGYDYTEYYDSRVESIFDYIWRWG